MVFFSILGSLTSRPPCFEFLKRTVSSVRQELWQLYWEDASCYWAAVEAQIVVAVAGCLFGFKVGIEYLVYCI